MSSRVLEVTFMKAGKARGRTDLAGVLRIQFCILWPLISQCLGKIKECGHSLGNNLSYIHC